MQHSGEAVLEGIRSDKDSGPAGDNFAVMAFPRLRGNERDEGNGENQTDKRPRQHHGLHGSAARSAGVHRLPAANARDRLAAPQKSGGKAMDMTGEFVIPAPRQKVWDALNDPAILQQCIPGCEAIEKLSDTELQAKVVAKVGPVRAHFGGKVTLSELDPPNGYKISGEGSGGAAGFAKGSAVVRLEPAGNGTRLVYDVDANVGGKLAQIGQRLIDGT